jgi:hypothetical protein
VLHDGPMRPWTAVGRPRFLMDLYHSFIHYFGHAPSNHTNLAMIIALIGVWVLCGLRVHTDTAGYTGRPWVGRTASVRGVDGFVG